MTNKRSLCQKGTACSCDKKLFILLLTALSFITAWIATSNKRTIFRDITQLSAEIKSVQEYTAVKLTITTHPTAVPHTVSMYGTRVNSSTADSNFTAVLLLTYMRSGSSITGEILQQIEEAFYVFEPFRVLAHLVKARKAIQWFNTTESSIDRVNITDVKRQSLIGWLTCNFSMIYAQAFDDRNFLSFGKKTTIYNDCILKYYGSKIYTVNGTSPRKYPFIRTRAFYRGRREKCRQDLQNACLASKVRIVKTIRTTMSLASDIMDEIKELKVINLIRDPRTTVVSQYRYSGCPGEKVTLLTCAYWHCGNVLSDIIVKQTVVLKSPGRILTIFYEHLASFPSEMAEHMYRFLGVKFTDILKSYAKKLVEGDNSKDCKVCQQSWQKRSLSNSSSDRQTQLSKYADSVLPQIKSICSDVLKYYGY